MRVIAKKFIPWILPLVIAAGCGLARPGTEVINGGAVFRVQAVPAHRVAVVGDFNHWDAERDRLTGPDDHGFWSGSVSLSPGRYEYLFLIDGTQWLLDPAAPSIDDGLGGRNSVITLPQKGDQP